MTKFKLPAIQYKYTAPLLGLILSSLVLTNCVVKGTGSNRKSVAVVEGGGENATAASDAVCLKIYQKRALLKAAALKLADEASAEGAPDTEGTETSTETAEETAACPEPAPEEAPAALRLKK